LNNRELLTIILWPSHFITYTNLTWSCCLKTCLANYQSELTEDYDWLLSKFIKAERKSIADCILFSSKVLFYKPAHHHVCDELVIQSQSKEMPCWAIFLCCTWMAFLCSVLWGKAVHKWYYKNKPDFVEVIGSSSFMSFVKPVFYGLRHHSNHHHQHIPCIIW
jgi:hypothetical protein